MPTGPPSKQGRLVNRYGSSLHPFSTRSVLIHVVSELEIFPELYAERGKLIAEEERSARLNTPLFVCQLSFPGVPTHLHFFEPR